MNSPNTLPAPCETLVTKYHHHPTRTTEPPSVERMMGTGEYPLLHASAPPMRAPATIGITREKTVRTECTASGPCRSKMVRRYSSFPTLIVLDYLASW